MRYYDSQSIGCIFHGRGAGLSWEGLWEGGRRTAAFGSREWNLDQVRIVISEI